MPDAQSPPKEAPYGAVTDAGFVWTAYNGAEAWFAIHEAARAVGARYAAHAQAIATAVSVFHDIISVGLGKAPYAHAVDVLQAWLPQAGTRVRLGTHPTPQLKGCPPQALDELRADVARAIRTTVCCAHCRTHGTRWFCAFVDANQGGLTAAQQRDGAGTRLEDTVAVQPQLIALHAHLGLLRARNVVPTGASGQRKAGRGAVGQPAPKRARVAADEPRGWADAARPGFSRPHGRPADPTAGPLALASMFAGAPLVLGGPGAPHRDRRFG